MNELSICDLDQERAELIPDRHTLGKGDFDFSQIGFSAPIQVATGGAAALQAANVVNVADFGW